MAALASSVSSPWIPEDDLLLKNAVEGGASLEALAKGAVRFSRKFTIGELRDRWHSLLYDPVISVEASARMVEFELSTSNSPSKVNRSGNFKESAEVPVKRKVESIRKIYYALRKRTCSRPCDSTNQSFLGSPNVNDCIGYASGCQEHVRVHNKPSVESCMLGDCVQNHFEFQEKGVDILHHGPQDSKPQEILKKNCFDAVPEKVPSWSVEESVRNDSCKQNDACKDIPHVLGDSANDFGNCSGVEGVGQSHALPDNSSSFHSIGYSSPQPGVPLWKTIEDISAPSMPVDVRHGGKNQDVEETLAVPDVMDGENITSSGYDVVHSGPMLKDRHVSDEINNTTGISESDFVDLSDSLLNLANEDELFMDADEKTTIDKSCYGSLNSLLLSTPNDVCEDDVPDVKEPQTLVLNKSLANPDGGCPTELEVITDLSHSGHGDQHSICCSDVNMTSSTSVTNPHSPELHDEMMECTLNSEDPEIPCNDDVLSGKAFASPTIQTGHTEAGVLASSFTNKKNCEQERNLRNKEDNPAQSFTTSQMVGSQMLPETSPNLPPVRHGVKPEFPDDNYYAKVSTQANIANAVPSQCRSTLAAPNSAADGVLKKDSLYACNETDVLLHGKASSTISTIPKPEANLSTSDQAESLNQEESESDDDVPYFSDIEAMILEMDLCPDDLDSSISREVFARYQDEDTKRTIIRLEQSARSSMQRATVSQGALAILYGHRLKHYIKETEVILGRATDDVDVDIDLGREGPANKISRRQALVKMERDGSFILKNLGKSSIFLNGKEVVTGQHISLSSSSLIEIRDMSFVFEINHKSVRRYLAKDAIRNQEENNKFEWSEKRPP